MTSWNSKIKAMRFSELFIYTQIEDGLEVNLFIIFRPQSIFCFENTALCIFDFSPCMTSKTVAATKVSGSKNILPLWSFASYPLEALEDMIRLIQLACKQKGCPPPLPPPPLPHKITWQHCWERGLPSTSQSIVSGCEVKTENIDTVSGCAVFFLFVTDT